MLVSPGLLLLAGSQQLAPARAACLGRLMRSLGVSGQAGAPAAAACSASRQRSVSQHAVANRQQCHAAPAAAEEAPRPAPQQRSPARQQHLSLAPSLLARGVALRAAAARGGAGLREAAEVRKLVVDAARQRKRRDSAASTISRPADPGGVGGQPSWAQQIVADVDVAAFEEARAGEAVARRSAALARQLADPVSTWRQLEKLHELWREAAPPEPSPDSAPLSREVLDARRQAAAQYAAAYARLFPGLTSGRAQRARAAPAAARASSSSRPPPQPHAAFARGSASDAEQLPSDAASVWRRNREATLLGLKRAELAKLLSCYELAQRAPASNGAAAARGERARVAVRLAKLRKPELVAAALGFESSRLLGDE